MLKKILLFSGLLAIVQFAQAQPPGTVSARLQAQQEARKSMTEEDYENRLRKPVLYGVYIPKDLGDVFIQFNKLTDEPSRKKFIAMSEADARHKLHFSLGRWITRNWGFYGGSRLTKYLNDIGLYEPDDMARFLIITYHRELNDKALGVKELVTEFQEMRRQEKQKRLSEGTVIYEETRKVTPPEEN